MTLTIRYQTAGLLSERLQAWKHAVGYLEEYVGAMEKLHKVQGKEYEKVLKVCSAATCSGSRQHSAMRALRSPACSYPAPAGTCFRIHTDPPRRYPPPSARATTSTRASAASPAFSRTCATTPRP